MTSTDQDFASYWVWNGRPYCDTCRQPAVVNEAWGVLHVTSDERGGVDPHNDPAGHPATILDWLRGATP